MNVYGKGIRQGCVIDCSAGSMSFDSLEKIQNGRALETARNSPIQTTDRLLVLSQNCDLNNPNEPCIELLPIRREKARRLAPEKQRARNFRKLQLRIDDEFWLLESEKISIVRKDIIDWQNAQIITSLGDIDRGLIIDWRVGRYNREPLPHNFNLAFLGALWDEEIGLGDYLSSNRDKIVDLYVYVSPFDNEYAEEYQVVVVAVIAEGCTLEEERGIESALTSYWVAMHNADNCLRMAQIDDSYAPDTVDVNLSVVARMSDFTLWDNYLMKRVTLDYLCYD